MKSLIAQTGLSTVQEVIVKSTHIMGFFNVGRQIESVVNSALLSLVLSSWKLLNNCAQFFLVKFSAEYTTFSLILWDVIKIHVNVNLKKIIAVKDIIIKHTPQIFPLALNTFMVSFFYLQKQFSFMSVFTRRDKKIQWTLLPKCHPTESQAHENVVCPYPPRWQDLAPCNLWLFPKVKLTIRDKCFELIKDDPVQNCFQKWQEWCDKCVWL